VASGVDDERDADGPLVAVDEWRKWRLEVLRVATRESTAILYLDDGARLNEQVRLNWDSTAHPPQTLRVGIGLLSAGANATVLVDEVWLTESERSAGRPSPA
jgi:hypothetical protein